MKYKLAIITPSYINNWQRYKFAKTSLKSLLKHIGRNYEIIVVDDIPCFKLPFLKLPHPFYSNKAKKIYDKPNIVLVRRPKGNSVSAIIDAIRVAESKKADLVFLHLDDSVYIKKLSFLLDKSIRSFELDEKLTEIRLSGRPIMSTNCNKISGNLTSIKYNNDLVTFEKVVLRPLRFKDFTLWWSYFKEEMIEDFWPIVMWGNIYKISFIKKLLLYDRVKDMRSLAEVEIFYQQRKNWSNFLKKHPGKKLGYINMQFCGFEMHRNKNWKELIAYPNHEIR